MTPISGGGTRGRTIEAMAMSDKHLRQEILDVFQWDPRIEAAHVAIAVEHGVVTLTGSVGSDDERIAAEQAIRHVVGVREVVERIEVRRPPDGTSRQDEAYLERATENRLVKPSAGKKRGAIPERLGMARWQPRSRPRA